MLKSRRNREIYKKFHIFTSSQGDRVFGFTALGGFAEECVVEQSVSLFCF